MAESQPSLVLMPMFWLLSFSQHKSGMWHFVLLQLYSAGALFSASCLKSEMEAYIYFPNTTSCLFSPSLQQLKFHSPFFWQATALLRMHSTNLLHFP